MAVVVFNYANWIVLYPEFATTVTEPRGQEFFYQAQQFCTNTDCAIIPYDVTCTPPKYARAIILNAITAHIAQLFAGSVVGGVPIPPQALVGRISDASEGSVNVSADMGTQPQSAAWWNQTKYGAMAYAMMARYRTARYQASPGRFAQVPGNWPPSQGAWPGDWGWGRG